MLLVFLMAALIAIALYNEMPRVAFEAQRAKEQLLIERGEQYERAIQLFVRKMHRYPATIDELENTNNVRFLRRRYIDPMTGKDKWRLIHINGGVLTDSIVQKNQPGQKQQQQNASTNTFIGVGPVMAGAENPEEETAVNPALRRRPSDGRPIASTELPGQPPAEGESADAGDQSGDGEMQEPGATNPNVPGMPTGTLPYQPGMYPPGTTPQQPGMPMQPGVPIRPGMINPALANRLGAAYGNTGLPNQAGLPGVTGGFPQQTNTGQNPNTGQNSDSSSSGSVYVAPGLGGSGTTTTPANPASPNPTTGAMPGAPFQTMPGTQQPFQQQSGFPGATPTPFGQPASTGFAGGASGISGGMFPGGAAPSNGITMSDLGLNGPRPGGMQGLPGMGGTQIGGGIAGVASEFKGPSIMVYHERQKYNEWEFVYDQSKDRGLAGLQAGGGTPGTPATQMGNMPGMNPQQPGAFGQTGATSSPFGNSTQTSPFFGQQPQQPQTPQQQPPN